MTDTNGYARQVELEFRRERTIGPSSLSALASLPELSRQALLRAMLFPNDVPFECVKTNEDVPQKDRVAAARLMLLKLGLDGDYPQWSSDLLERLLRRVTETPGGEVSDLIEALFEILSEDAPSLNPVMANLIKELIVRCFARDRDEYESFDWKSICKRVEGNPSPPLLYFLLHAVPPEQLPAHVAATIRLALVDTDFAQEAATVLAE